MHSLLAVALSAVLLVPGRVPVVAADAAVRFGVETTRAVEFNEPIAIRYAQVAMAELDAIQHQKDFAQYDPESPLLASMTSYDCEKVERKIVLVAFAHRAFRDRFAYVYFILDKDKFLKIHIRGYQLAPAKTLLELPANSDEFWACGV